MKCPEISRQICSANHLLGNKTFCFGPQKFVCKGALFIRSWMIAYFASVDKFEVDELWKESPNRNLTQDFKLQIQAIL